MKGIGRQATERYARRFTQRAFIQAQLKFIQLESARLADEAARTRQQQITAAMKARIDYVLITDYGAEWADATRDEPRTKCVQQWQSRRQSAEGMWHSAAL